MKPSEIARAAGISVPYASQIIDGHRRPSLEVALRIYDGTGALFGPLTGLSKREVETARKMSEAA